MTNSLTKPKRLALDVISAGLLVCIAAGVLLRFTNLGLKFYWGDESFSSLRAAGHAVRLIDSAGLAGRLWSPQALVARYHTPQPGEGFTAVLAATLEPGTGHPPMFELLAHGWMRLFGARPAAMRALPALFSVLILLAAYALAREMGWRGRAPLLAAALLAVSPFQIVYAQEMRSYSLLALLALLASLLLLRALRRNGWGDWLLYALALIGGLYAHLLFVSVVAAHGAYVLLSMLWPRTRPFPRPDRRLLWFALATAAAALLYAPWLRLAYSGPRGADSWATVTLPLQAALRLWAVMFSAPLVDLYPLPGVVEALAAAAALLLLALALLAALRDLGREGNLLLLLLFAASLALLFGPDLLWGGQRSSVSRYAIVALTVGSLLVAHLLAGGLRGGRPWLWRGITAAVLLLGLISSILYARAPAWRGKGNDESYVQVIQELNDAGEALILVDILGPNGLKAIVVEIIGMSHQLHEGLRWRFAETLPDAPPGQTVYAFRPTAEGLALLAGGRPYRAQEVVPGLLWRLWPP